MQDLILSVVEHLQNWNWQSQSNMVWLVLWSGDDQEPASPLLVGVSCAAPAPLHPAAGPERDVC